jgi:hypothetical protein
MLIRRLHGFIAFCLALATLAVGFAAPAWATTSAPFPAKRFGGLYSSTSPAAVLSALNTSLASGEQRTWTRDDLSASAFSQIGAALVTSIPGQSVDLTQSGNSLTVSNDVATEQFDCPSPSANTRYPAIEAVQVVTGGKAALTFCPSKNRLTMLPVDTTKEPFAGAFREYLSDPLRSHPFGGDSYGSSLWLQCRVLLRYDPEITVRYRHGALHASFQGMSPMDYCDRVGQSTQEATAQIRPRGARHYRQLGRGVLAVMGLREILVFTSKHDFPNSAIRLHAAMPDTKLPCGAGMRGAQVRIKLVQRFRWMDSQQFVHYHGSEVRIRPETFYSSRIRPCRRHS